MVVLEQLAPGNTSLTAPEAELSQRKSPTSFGMDIPINSSCFHLYAKDVTPGAPLELLNILPPTAERFYSAATTFSTLYSRFGGSSVMPSSQLLSGFARKRKWAPASLLLGNESSFQAPVSGASRAGEGWNAKHRRLQPQWALFCQQLVSQRSWV